MSNLTKVILKKRSLFPWMLTWLVYFLRIKCTSHSPLKTWNSFFHSPSFSRNHRENERMKEWKKGRWSWTHMASWTDDEEGKLLWTSFFFIFSSAPDASDEKIPFLFKLMPHRKHKECNHEENTREHNWTCLTRKVQDNIRWRAKWWW